MAYSPGVIKTVVGGTLPSGEAFAFGWQMLADPATGQNALNQINGSCVAALTNNFLTVPVKALFPNTVRFQTLRNYLYIGGITAALVSESTGINIPGNSSTVSLPMQCAEVVTLETGVPGRRNRGRAYLPPVAQANFTAAAQLDAASCTTLANAFADMLTAINGNATPDVTCVVASATGSSTRNITRVHVDSIIDTQRRRRNKALPSSSIAAAVTN